MNKQEFIQYLEETLIPSLKESEQFEMAKDFEAAIHLMENPEGTVFNTPTT